MTLKYKGYIGSVEVDMEDGILYGKLLHIRDLINYEAETPAELKAAFEEAVDDYLHRAGDERRVLSGLSLSDFPIEKSK